MGMIDVTEKPIIYRKAEAAGKIFLSPTTVEEIKAGRIKKGDPLLVAEVAAMNAAKQIMQIVMKIFFIFSSLNIFIASCDYKTYRI